MIEQFENKIINADCLDILKQLPDKCIDLVLTDPPYGLNKKFKGGKSGKMNFNSIVDKGWDFTPDKEVFEEIVRVSKNQIIWGGNYFADMLPPSRCWIVWDKMIAEDFSLAMLELAWTSFDKNAKIFRYASEKDFRLHPTQKPLQLFKKCIAEYSKEGDLIADFFSGSGTTAVACWELKRRFLCTEKDFDYWKASCKRLEDRQRQGVLF